MGPHAHHDHHGHDHGGHSHGGHGHHHAHAPADFGRAFAIGTALNLGFVIVEAGYGLAAGSMALLADAGHNFGDVIGLVVAWGAGVLGRRPPRGRFTYGLGGSSILAALTNALLLLLATGGIVVEAVQRLGTQGSAPVPGATVMWVAGVGILVNGGTALMFARGRRGDINVRGAFLHMAADAAISAGVVLAGFVILRTGWTWIDPLASLGICVAIGLGTWGLLRDAVAMSLHAAPAGIDPDAVAAHLASLPGVAAVHDLHVWPMSTTETALTVHLLMPGGYPGDGFASGAAATLRARYGIGHTTIQVETDAAADCMMAPHHGA